MSTTGIAWDGRIPSRTGVHRSAGLVRAFEQAQVAGRGAGLNGLYTPQMIVDGAVQFSGQRRETAACEIARAAERPPAFDLAVKATVRGSAIDLSIDVPAVGSDRRDRDWRIVAALVAKETRAPVHRSENAGEVLDEAAVVRALSERLPLPFPRSPARIQLSKPADLSWAGVDVVFAQSEARVSSVRFA
jgi:hypothetical protein